MDKQKPTLGVGIVQMSPVWLDKDATIEKMRDKIDRAAEMGCELLAFGEGILPGYPFWIEHTDGARFESSVQKDFYAHYIRQSIDIERGQLDSICEKAKSHRMSIVTGIIEKASSRGGHSVYASTIFIAPNGDIVNVHRKLMPTYEERLVWAQGDGHGLKTFPIGEFKMGMLNCWENWMPLARTALYQQGENLHIATWPGNVRNTIDITRFIARESRSYVLSACGLLKKEDIPKNSPHYELLIEQLPAISANGGSCIAGPDGQWIIEPFANEETILTAQLNFNEVLRERHNFDVNGHYSRPDILELSVNHNRY